MLGKPCEAALQAPLQPLGSRKQMRIISLVYDLEIFYLDPVSFAGSKTPIEGDTFLDVRGVNTYKVENWGLQGVLLGHVPNDVIVDSTN